MAAAVLALGLLPPAAAADVDGQPWRFDGVERVVAIGDVHGAYDELVGVLQESGLISDDLAWTGGTSYLVMLGDLVDRGARSRDVLDLVMRLQREAQAAGGRVHVVLGNHEVMNLVGNLSYTSPEELEAFADDEDPKQRKRALKRTVQSSLARNGDLRKMRQLFEKRYPPGYFGHRQAFSPDGVYGRWLLDQQIVVMIDGVVFVHGGLPPMLLDMSPDDINAVGMGELRGFVEAQQRLYDLDVLGPEMSFADQIARVQSLVQQADGRGAAGQEVELARTLFELAEGMVFRRDGPLWYRGTSLNPEADEEPLVHQVLAHLGGSSVVVGHTPVHTGRLTTRFDGAVVLADTGMLADHYGGRGAALEIEHGRLAAFYPGEGETSLAAQRWELTAGAFPDDAALEEFLRSAEIVWMEEVGSGSTEPMQVGLADDGRRAKAIFKTIESDGRRYEHELAAYRLDRMLDLGMVPPTVLREINGVTGSLQLWVDNAVSEGDRRDENLRPADPAAFARELDAATVFDLVIFNIDRNGSNMLVTLDDSQVHLIDHERAFAARLPSEPYLQDARDRLDDEMVRRLDALRNDGVRTRLADLLSERQIEALLERVELVLSRS